MFRVFLFIFMVVSFPALSAERVLVFAAASQRDALQEIGRAFETKCDCNVVFSFAATSTLARQIDAGAKADAFISANEAWMDWLEIRNNLRPATRAIVAGNRLAIASGTSTEDGLDILLQGKFAMADPVSVPAGIYAREALENLGVWRSSRKNAVYSENVRVALSSVNRGDLLSGIVYLSDLMLTDELATHYVFPEESHTPIHYVAAALKQSTTGAEFVAYLKSKQAQEVFERFGFLPLSATH